jgi:primosomal protein N' (replication factor Y)
MSTPAFARVALLDGPPEPLTYLIPAESAGLIAPGWAVEAELGRRRALGLVLETLPTPDVDCDIKPLKPLGDGPILPASRLPFLQFLASYYFSSLGQAASLLPFRSFEALAKRSRAKKAAKLEPKASVFPSWEVRPRLTGEQEAIFREIAPEVKSGVFHVHLVFGTTGSGKTLLYLSLAAFALKKGLSVLYLLPEIGLTEAFTEKIRLLISGDPQLLVWHSKLSLKTRREAIEGLLGHDTPRLILGARSALFLPFKNLGVVIVDEEHDASYKESKEPYYHARDMAILLAKLEGCPAVLGSATPSLETMQNVFTGKYAMHAMPTRFGGMPLPRIELVHLAKGEEGLVSKNPPVSLMVAGAIAGAIKEGQSVLVFANRRGYARLVLCEGCGTMSKCPNCSQYLVYHKAKGSLSCHICGFHLAFPKACAVCAAKKFKLIGFGTERLEQSLAELFFEANIVRFDRDTLNSVHHIRERLTDLQDQGGAILVGTQLISKGYHMPKVSLAVILLAENMFCFPDFRALERGVQLVSQIGGRSGRGDTPGRILVQTFMESDVLKDVLGEQNYIAFVETELKERKRLRLPPFWKLALIRLECLKRDTIEAAAVSFQASIKEEAKRIHANAFVLPAEPAPIEQKRAKFEYHILIKAKNQAILREVLLPFKQRLGLSGGVRIAVDIDPVDML